MNIISKIDDYINFLLMKIVPITLFILLSILIIITISDIFTRFVFSRSLTGARSFTKYIFIWMVFIGMCCGIKDDDHFKITEIRDKFPEILQKLVIIIMYLLALVFFIVFFYVTTFRVIPNIWGRPEISTGINTGLLRMCMSIGSFLVIIAITQKLTNIFSSKFRDFNNKKTN